MVRGTSRRGLLRIAATAIAVACASPAFAQSPGGYVRLVVGYTPGGPVDTAARQFAPVLSRELGRPVVIDNRPGVAGLLGAEVVAKSAPDGNTFYFGASPSLTITPHVMKVVAITPAKDLTPVSPLSTYANVLVVNDKLPVKTLPELIAYAKAHPGTVSYGSAGMGASNHLSGELFARQAGVTLTHVPYKGSAPAAADVMGGQTAMMFDIVSTARANIATGRLRALAITSKERNPSLPEVPTMREAGLAGYEVIGWYGLYGPAGMGAEQVRQLNAAVNKALADPALRKTWEEQGYVMWTGEPARLAAQQKGDDELWRGVTAGMKFE